jgi:hypothetical protein
MDLSWRGYQQVGTAHDIAHSLLGIIHHHGQLVGPETIGAQQDKVADVCRQVLLVRPCSRSTKATGASSTRKRQAWLLTLLRQPSRHQPG